MLLAVASATSVGVEAGLRRTVWEMLLTIPYGQTIILPLGRAKYRTQKEILLLKL
jgi:hypothetical protein